MGSPVLQLHLLAYMKTSLFWGKDCRRNGCLYPKPLPRTFWVLRTISSISIRPQVENEERLPQEKVLKLSTSQRRKGQYFLESKTVKQILVRHFDVRTIFASFFFLKSSVCFSWQWHCEINYFSLLSQAESPAIPW